MGMSCAVDVGWELDIALAIGVKVERGHRRELAWGKYFRDISWFPGLSQHYMYLSSRASLT